MKTQNRRYTRSIITLLLIAVIASMSFIGISSALTADRRTDTINVKDITDKVDSIAGEYALSEENQSLLSGDDLCWAIVRLNSASVLEKAFNKNPRNIYDYINSEAALAQAGELSAYQDDFLARNQNVIVDTSYRYTTLLNGVAVYVKYRDIAKLEADPNVSSVIISERYQTPKAITQNQVSIYPTGIYNPGNVDYDGTNTIVAVLDTGLDYTHQAFANLPTGKKVFDKDKVVGLMSNLLATEYSANKDKALTADDVYLSDKVPYAYDYADRDPDVYPVSNHGTHVAGIIAGKDDTITGVAPQAQLAIMKVFSNYEEGASSEGILAALNDCVVLGVDAINMSLGAACGFAREADNDATNEIYDLIRSTGICLITAASNDNNSAMQSTHGDTGLATNPDIGTVGSPSSYEASMSVASISGVKTRYLVADGAQEIYFTEAGKTGSEKHDFAKELLKDLDSAEFDYVVVPGLGDSGNYNGLDVAGKIAVVKRGNLSFEDKAKNALKNGAVGIIIYNNISGNITMTLGTTKIPACSISMDMGKYFETHTGGKIKIDKNYLAGPFMSDFSSWGPLADLELKPDITAHGGDIYSAVRGGYDYYSGTSMAAPNMSGATILVREYVKERFPELSAYEVTELTYQLIMSTATIAYNEEGNPYSPRKQGAGLADIGKSIDTLAYAYVQGKNKTKLSLGDDVAKTGVYKMTFNVKNLRSSAVSYRINPLIMTETLSSDYKTVAQKAHMFKDSEISYSVKGEGGALTSTNVLVLSGFSDAELTVTVKLSQNAKKYIDDNFANGMFVEGFVELISLNDDKINLNVPFLAFYGDWSVAPMLDADAYEVGKEQEDSSILPDDKLKEDVYATLPMAGFRYKVSATEYQESFYGMGQFSYKIADGFSEPAILEDKASLTVDMEGNYSLKIIAAGLLRNAKTVHMQITDSVTGEVVWTATDYNVRKSYYSGGRRPGAIEVDFNVNEHNLANNSRYKFSMECELDWESTEKNLSNTYEFEFYIDNEAPIIAQEKVLDGTGKVVGYKDRVQVRQEIDADGRIRYKLDIYAYDNHYIQGYAIGTFSSIGSDGAFNGKTAFHNYLIPFAECKRNSVNRITYDITDHWDEINKNDGKLYVQLVDYAKNTKTYQITLPSSTVTALSFKNPTQTLSLDVYDSADLRSRLVATPSNLWVDGLVWSVDDDSIAMVSNGILIGLKKGDAVLSVETKDGSAKTTLRVKVNQGRNTGIEVSKIEVDKISRQVEVGEIFNVKAKAYPHCEFEGKGITLSDGTALDDLLAPYELVWSSSDVFKFARSLDDNKNLTDTAEGESVYVRAMKANRKNVDVAVENKYNDRITAVCSVTVKLDFEIEGNLLKSYTGRGDENGVVEIPADKNISMIYEMAIINNPYITKIIVPEGVEEIMEAAIYGNSALKEIVLPASCKKIDKWGLGWNVSLEKVELGGVDTIGELAFYNSKMLTDIDLSKVFLIGPRAFAFCDSLEQIDLSSCKQLDAMAFALCASLTKVVTGENTVIGDQSFRQCYSLVEVEINGGYVGQLAFADCTGLQSVTFNNPVDTIELGAFYRCGVLSELNFRSTVRVIKAFAFANCAFNSVYIPAGLEELGQLAFGFDDAYAAYYGGPSEVIISADAKLSRLSDNIFFNCKNLQSFTVEDGNAYLSSSNGILYDKAQKTVLLCPYGYTNATVELPSTVTTIGQSAFSGIYAVKTVNGANVVNVEDMAFMGAYVSSVKFSDSLYKIGFAAFYGTGYLTAWPACFNNAEYIGDQAFQKSGLSGKLVIPDSVTYLGTSAFAQTSLSEVQIGDGITSIPGGAFRECAKLKTIWLGENIKSIGDYAFTYCESLTGIVMPDTLTEVGYAAFAFCGKLESVRLSENLTGIADFMFMNSTSLKSIVLPVSVKTIGASAFAAMDEKTGNSVRSNLSQINLNYVQFVDQYAFANALLTEINAPELALIGKFAFAGCPITTANVPAAEYLGQNAFYSCTVLETVNVNGAIEIAANAFYGCKAIKSIALPATEKIGGLAFYGANSLTSVTFGSLKTVGSGAFAGTMITSVVLPASVEKLNVQAFYGASKLATVTVSDNNPYYFVSDGILYKKLPNGMYALVLCPAALPIKNYSALDKTVRVDGFAFAGNVSIESVVLPERLLAVGGGAFYGCTKLKDIEFNCTQAPVLENFYDKELGIDNHYYNNFQNTSSKNSTVTFTYPKNGSGYDSYVWNMQFEKSLNRGTVAYRTGTTIDVSDSLNALAIDTLTLNDAKAIASLRRICDSLDATQRGFLSAELSKLVLAESKIGSLVKALIDALPQKAELSDKIEVNRVRAFYESLSAEMKLSVSNLDKLESAEKRITSLEEGDESGGWVLPVAIGVPALLIAAGIAAFVLIRKKKMLKAYQNAESAQSDKPVTKEDDHE